MNVVKEIQSINAKQLELGGNSSWHDQYKDSAYVFVGGLDYDLTEGDVVTIFSQYVADVNIPKDKKTQKSKGFAFLMYEDQRSTVLAVDNLNGAKVLERILRVDHVDKYKQLEQDSEGKYKEREEQSLNARPENFLIKEGGEAGQSSSDSDEGDANADPDLLDPMAAYLKEQKKANKKSSSSKGKGKHEGETKEEKKARKLAKRVAKQAKKYGMLEDVEPSQKRGRSPSPDARPRRRSRSPRSGRRDRSQSRDRRDRRRSRSRSSGYDDRLRRNDRERGDVGTRGRNDDDRERRRSDY